ncbi:MAG: enoyl-CoA hydratase/isomerase family protein [Spirochaetes bacterium]|nr:enoyl-CoA hydratase/isomerase family protein [Spirochaetota bacterium]
MRGIVIRGAGRHFSSGADLDDLRNAVSDRGARAPALLRNNLSAFGFFENCGVPVVAAIQGVCLGSAFELALACHARVCGAGSVLGLPESTFGLMPGCGGITRMLSLAGRARTLELVLSGATFTAEEALAWNLVDVVTPRKHVIAGAVEMIERITAGSAGIQSSGRHETDEG